MNFETPLCKIAYKYGVDRCGQICHNYTPFYWELLKDRRESVKKVVELGVGSRAVMASAPKQYRTGAGLFMWREFFPNAQIFGVDINPNAQVVGEERIETFVLDSTKDDDLEVLISKVGSDIDLLIDDAIHFGCFQIPTCLFLMPYLRVDGIYVIEDIQNGKRMAQALEPYDCRLMIATRTKRDGMIVVRYPE